MWIVNSSNLFIAELKCRNEVQCTLYNSNVYTLNTEKIRQQKTNNQNISDYRAYLYMGQAGVM